MNCFTVFLLVIFSLDLMYDQKIHNIGQKVGYKGSNLVWTKDLGALTVTNRDTRIRRGVKLLKNHIKVKLKPSKWTK